MELEMTEAEVEAIIVRERGDGMRMVGRMNGRIGNVKRDLKSIFPFLFSSFLFFVFGLRRCARASGKSWEEDGKKFRDRKNFFFVQLEGKSRPVS